MFVFKKPVFFGVFFVVVAFTCAMLSPSVATAQNDFNNNGIDDNLENNNNNLNNGFNNFNNPLGWGGGWGPDVGGVAIDAKGILDNLHRKKLAKIAGAGRKALEKVPAGMQAGTTLRKVSLRRLIEQCAELSRQNKTAKKAVPVPDRLKYLAGLQRVRYVFVYPEKKDIVLAGPAEAWKVDGAGNVVGATTGRPVLHLEDLLVALRAAATPNPGPITCSIDPNPEGVSRMRSFLKTQKTIGNPRVTMSRIEQSLGPQKITVAGVPDTSRFARVMVASDYRMKRMAMGFDKAPVKGMPSFLQMVRARQLKNMMPRWWLTGDYEALLTDEDGLAWELRGRGVKAMTEDEVVTRDGHRIGTGKADQVAKKWADAMTAKYDDLSAKEPIFGQLRNCMDLAVVGALIVSENLPQKAGCDLSPLLNTKLFNISRYEPARRVDSKASFVKKGRNWLISASGGVAITPFEYAAKHEKSKTVAPVRAKSATTADTTWWWN